MDPSSALSPICPTHTFDLDTAFILDMSVTVGVDLEAGLMSEESKFRGVGIVGRSSSQDDDTPGTCRTERQPDTGSSEGGDVVADSGFGNTSEKMSDLYPIKSERHVDVVLERWKDDRESILLAVLLAATISLFVIEGYNTLSSQDMVDQAIALFNQVTSLDEALGRDVVSVPLGQSSSVIRATALWLLSLWLNITCVVCVLWQQWWPQCIDLVGPHMPARLRHYLSPGVGTRLAKYRMMVEEENWVLSKPR
ncbi:hypothetical protein BGY98DRAFT_669333 [Russula aff. rugulosa BPL654]|nr:hypothetical protein BGY98DRAFT_669333 [Russula aff. rugulosa BPL654]